MEREQPHVTPGPSNDYLQWYAQRFGLPLDGVRDLLEISRDQVIETDWPKSLGIPHCLEYLAPGQFMEQTYYGVLAALRDLGYASIVKVVDDSTAAQESAAYGVAEQRRLAVQDRVAQQMSQLQQSAAALSTLVQDLRELDRRLAQFDESEQDNSAGQQADAAFKAEFLDRIDGGAMNPASIFGIAQRLNVPELPGLFHGLRRLPLENAARANEMSEVEGRHEELAQRVKALSIDAVSRDVLIQKLLRYYQWKDAAWRDHRGQRQLLLANLRTQYGLFRLTVTQVKPLLRTLRRQAMTIDRSESPELPSMFDATLNETELLAKKRVSSNGPYAVVLVSLQFLTRPPQKPAYGLLRPSSVTAQWRAYCWSDDDIARFIGFRQSPDLDLLGEASEELRRQLSSIDEELSGYLREAGVLPPSPAPPEVHGNSWAEEIRSIFDPLSSVADGLLSAIRWLTSRRESAAEREAEELAARTAKHDAWAAYKAFKTAHGMLTW
jgi:hypothetical protein